MLWILLLYLAFHPLSVQGAAFAEVDVGFVNNTAFASFAKTFDDTQVLIVYGDNVSCCPVAFDITYAIVDSVSTQYEISSDKNVVGRVALEANDFDIQMVPLADTEKPLIAYIAGNDTNTQVCVAADDGSDFSVQCFGDIEGELGFELVMLGENPRNIFLFYVSNGTLYSRQAMNSVPVTFGSEVAVAPSFPKDYIKSYSVAASTDGFMVFMAAEDASFHLHSVEYKAGFGVPDVVDVDGTEPDAVHIMTDGGAQWLRFWRDSGSPTGGRLVGQFGQGDLGNVVWDSPVELLDDSTPGPAGELPIFRSAWSSGGAMAVTAVAGSPSRNFSYLFGSEADFTNKPRLTSVLSEQLAYHSSVILPPSDGVEYALLAATYGDLTLRKSVLSNCECTSGECCDTDHCTFQPENFPCPDAPCNRNFCSGTSDSCFLGVDVDCRLNNCSGVCTEDGSCLVAEDDCGTETAVNFCEDGMLNNGEFDVDCGGVCPPCPIECRSSEECDAGEVCVFPGRCEVGFLGNNGNAGAGADDVQQPQSDALSAAGTPAAVTGYLGLAATIVAYLAFLVYRAASNKREGQPVSLGRKAAYDHSILGLAVVSVDDPYNRLGRLLSLYLGMVLKFGVAIWSDFVFSTRTGIEDQFGSEFIYRTVVSTVLGIALSVLLGIKFVKDGMRHQSPSVAKFSQVGGIVLAFVASLVDGLSAGLVDLDIEATLVATAISVAIGFLLEPIDIAIQYYLVHDRTIYPSKAHGKVASEGTDDDLIALDVDRSSATQKTASPDGP